MNAIKDECPAAEGQQLFPIDKLRYFAQENVNKFYGSKKGLFRVNAIKLNDMWIEYKGNVYFPCNRSNSTLETVFKIVF